MSDPSIKPYLVRAVHEWCTDQGYTPYLSVTVDSRTVVPFEFVKDGQIVLNVSANASRNLFISNDMVTFSARFNGVAQNIQVPMSAVGGIYARENGQGLFFPTGEEEGAGGQDEAGTDGGGNPPPSPPKGRPSLKIVK
jgi:stringent starvation protein B